MSGRVGVATNVKGHKKKKRSAWAGALTGVVLVLVACICVALFTPLFNIEVITVNGNSKISAEFITESAAVSIGSNIFRADISRAKKNIMSIPVIDTAEVRRKFPKGIEITVTECEPAVAIPFVSGYVICDKTGKATEAVKDKSGYMIPVVVGVSLSGCELGSPISFTEEGVGRLLFALTGELKTAELLEKTTKIDLSNIYELQVIIEDKLYVNYGGGDDLPYKTQMLTNVIANIQSPPKGYVDLRAGDNVFYKENYSPT